MTDLPQQSIYGENPRLEIRPFLPPDARSALDVGCGSGGFASTLRSVLGPEARLVGMDPMDDNVASARALGGFDDVWSGYFPRDVPAEAGAFDLISFLDVLEHLLDPWTVLSQAVGHLNPGGRVVAAIPSIQYWPVVNALVRGRWDYADTGTLDRTHVRFFTKATMVEMFEGAGLVVERCEGVNSILDSPKSVVRNYRRIAWLLPDLQWLHFVVVGRRDT